MPKVRFTSDFNFRRPLVTVAYKAGMKALVTTPCAKEAIEKGKAVLLEPKDRTPRSPIRTRRRK